MFKLIKKAKAKTKKLASLVAVAMCATLAIPSVAFAADDGLNNPTSAGGEIHQYSVTQSINSANQYTWTSNGKTYTGDNDIYGRVIKGDSGDWGYIWYGSIPATWSGLGANSNGWWHVTNGWVVFNNTEYNNAVNMTLSDGSDTSYARDGLNAPLLPIWKTILNSKDSSGGYRNLWASFGGSNNLKVTDNNTVLQNDNGWWYLNDGAVDFTFTGLSQNENGEWYIDDGSVDFGASGLYQDKEGNLKIDNAWYYVVNGKVQEGMEEDIVKIVSDIDEVDADRTGAWWHISNGKVIQGDPIIAKNSNGWWYCNSYGMVDFTFTGVGSNSNGLWWVEEGKVNFSKNGRETYNGVTYNIVNGQCTPV